MRKMSKTAAVLATVMLLTICAFAEGSTILSGCGIQSIEMPSGAKIATRDLKSDNPLLQMLGTDKNTLYQTMVDGNTYLISFVINETQAIQYMISATDNATLPNGTVNGLTEEQLGSVAEQIKSFITADGTSSVTSTSAEMLSNGSFVAIDGNLADEASGTKLSFRTYATIQSGKLIMIRALNYAGGEFTPELLTEIKVVAESAAFEPYNPKSSETSSENAADQTTAAPKEHAASQATVAPAENTTSQPIASATENAASQPSTAPTESAESEPTAAATDETTEENGGNRNYIWIIIVIIVLLGVAAVFITKTRKNKKTEGKQA